MKGKSYKDYIDYIKKDEIEETIHNFLKITNINDLCLFLQEPKSKILYYLIKSKTHYNTFEIPKKNGGYRTISAPSFGLKRIQKKLNYVLNLVYNKMPKKSAHGFVLGKSIVTNARQHLKRKFVLNIDLKDFFPSIHFGRVKGLFQSKPFEFNEEIAKILAKLCTNEGVLPQGAPTSPILTNLIVRRMDAELEKLAKKNKCVYTRYADDITFSFWEKNLPPAILIAKKKELPLEAFNERVSRTESELKKYIHLIKNESLEPASDKLIIEYNYTPLQNKFNDRLIKRIAYKNNLNVQITEQRLIFKSGIPEYQVELGSELVEIIERNGFSINFNKVRLQPPEFRQEVTGLTVNKKVNIQRRYYKQVRAMLHCWKKNGYNYAETKYEETIKLLKKPYRYFQMALLGKINFIGQVRGKKDHLYRKLKEEYLNLVNPIKTLTLDEKIEMYRNEITEVLNNSKKDIEQIKQEMKLSNESNKIELSNLRQSIQNIEFLIKKTKISNYPDNKTFNKHFSIDEVELQKLNSKLNDLKEDIDRIKARIHICFECLLEKFSLF